MEPKEEPIDSFDYSFAGHEINNVGNCSPLVEPKEEPLDDFLLNPAENEICHQHLSNENDCKKEEVTDDDEILNLPPPLSPVKDEPIVDEYIQDLVRLGQIPAWDAKLDQSARHGLSPAFPVIPQIEDFKEEIVSIKDEFPIFDDVVGQPSSLVEVNYEAVDRGYIAKEKSSDLSQEEGMKCSKRVTLKRNFIDSVEDSDDEDKKNDLSDETIRMRLRAMRRNGLFNLDDPSEISTPQCLLCEKYPLTAHAYAYHLTQHHKYSLIANETSLLCSCGSKVHSHVPNPRHMCDGFNFTLQKQDSIITPEKLASTLNGKCILCETYPTNVYDYASHIVFQHKTTLRTQGYYIICSCKVEVRDHRQVLDHVKKCDGRQFAIYKEEGTVQCVFCEKRPLTISQYISHLNREHRSTLTRVGIYLRCSCGHEVRSADDYNHNKCDGRNFTIHELEGTVQCVMCEMRPLTVRKYIQHLSNIHKSTLYKKGIYLLCSCGFKARGSNLPYHNKCDGLQFTIHECKEGIVKCVLCERRPLNVHRYATHLKNVHKSSLNKNGIYLRCSCGFEVRSSHRHAHHLQCTSLEFTIHKLEEK